MDVIKYFNKKQKDIMQASANRLGEALIEVAEGSLAVSPIDTGALRESYRVRVNGAVLGKGNADKSLTKFNETIPIRDKSDTIYGVISVEALAPPTGRWPHGFGYPWRVHNHFAKTGIMFYLLLPFQDAEQRIKNAVLLRG